MMLPADVARCEGYVASDTRSRDNAECAHCRRREEHTPDPDCPDRPFPHMEPPRFINGRCPSRIGQEDAK